MFSGSALRAVLRFRRRPQAHLHLQVPAPHPHHYIHWFESSKGVEPLAHVTPKAFAKRSYL